MIYTYFHSGFMFTPFTKFETSLVMHWFCDELSLHRSKEISCQCGDIKFLINACELHCTQYFQVVKFFISLKYSWHLYICRFLLDLFVASV